MRSRGWFVAGAASLLACGSSADASPSGDDAALDAGTDAIVAESAADVADDTAASDVPDAFDAPAEAGVLDCKWVNDTKNCWRTFVTAVDGCLANPVGTVRGTLTSDDASCSYPSGGRTIAFAIAPMPDGGPDRADRDFTASLGAKTCLHYVEHAATVGFTATGPIGTLTYSAVGNDVTVVCPDGARFEGDALAVAKLCGPAVFAGGTPDRTAVESAGVVRFQLAGMKDVVYACVVPGDAG